MTQTVTIEADYPVESEQTQESNDNSDESSDNKNNTDGKHLWQRV